ncbi:EAL domain-containing protein [Pseudothauera rhizosphaerae]|uniref:EAL domain-containing protein n=1 Tax=Pseudothauera rhizosphaerae TaxID=2565932 RepID=A0A4S4AV07_9RHOO|nr:EAL domain-containing protein [Pseudothauera rhizosphaerae]THF63370.1 EAL domain-containing protein [Pseudothauera rhizosphaerae]
MRRLLIVSGFIALAYAATGWISLQIAVPPGYSAPFFPPAGIALAALLIFGRRHVGGVILGAFAVQVIGVLRSGAPLDLSWTPFVVPLSAGLQALAGAWLARRLIGFPNALDTPGAILRYMLLVAPLGCLVNASIAVPLLTHGGLIPPGEALFNWWNWWVGDTLGVLIASPPMFVFFGNPREDWRTRRLAVALPMSIAIVLTGAALYQLSRWETMRIQTQFNRDSEQLAGAVRKRLDAQIDMMLAVDHFMAISRAVDRHDFREFVTPWLERHPGTQNFGWSPYVEGRRRAAFETAVRAAHGDGFTILARDLQGRTLPAPPAAEHLPIVFVEPFAANAAVYGLDPLSLPATAQAIGHSRRTRAPVVSEGIRLVQERGTQRGVVVYSAVFDHPAGGREPALLGVVSGVLRMDDILAAILDSSGPTDLELCLADPAAAPGNRRLYGPEGCTGDGWLRQHIGRAVPVRFAGREWQLRVRDTVAYIHQLRSWTAWTTIPIGLGTLGMLGAFLLMTSGHTRRISHLVDERTAQLADATRTLAAQGAALNRAQRIARLGSWECEPDGSGLAGSDELGALLHLPAAASLTLEDLSAAVHEDDRPALRGALAAAAQWTGEQALDCRPRDNPGRVLHFQIASEWRDERPVRLRGTVQDVTATRQAEAHIQYLAHYDALTGLPNRSLWLTRAQGALHVAQRHGDSLAVLFLDLDQFKTVNDSLGHPAGDLLLATVASRLAPCLREEDVLARLGGDEFVALLPRLAHPEDAAMVARKMLAALDAPIDIHGQELRPTISIGIAVHPADGDDVDTLLKHADTAMYGAKEAGRNNFQFFVPEMNVRARERLMLENALRRAIERDELSLHYQPQLRADDGRLTGCEALVRWLHPEMGAVMPAQFIPVAEDSGLIVPLGEWVLRQACRQQAAWARAGLGGLMVAVNISALQFRRADFTGAVTRILAETGADPAWIELEITESALMQPSTELHERLVALGRMGLTLALDDFGTGYSSLAYLKRLPISRLKIDRSFVKDLPGDQEDAAVASATLSLGRDLGLEVVAEGVEQPEQFAWLQARGCAKMQGYLFARPMPADEFARWAAAHDPAAVGMLLATG